MSVFVSRIWTQPGNGIKTQATSAEFHYYGKSNLFPDFKILLWPFGSLLIKQVIYIVEATSFMKQECTKNVYLFNVRFLFSISKSSFIKSFNFLE